MTGKLIKFEIYSSIKLLGVLWAALITASLLLGIEGKTVGNITEGFNNTLLVIMGTLLPLIYFLVFGAMIVAVVLLVIMRFYKGLLGEEGYLMHTLPVSTWQLIVSKAVTACIIVVLSGIVMTVSILISSGIAGLDIDGMFQAIVDDIHNDRRVILLIAATLICGIVGILSEIYEAYLAMAIGQMAPKRRILASIGAYIGIEIVIGAISMLILSASVNIFAIETMFENYESDSFGVMLGAMLLFIAVCAVQIAAYHFATNLILKKKLALQ